MNENDYDMRINIKTQNYLLCKSKRQRMGVYKVCDENIHLINSPLIRDIMMEESLVLPQFLLDKAQHPIYVRSISSIV